MKIGIYCKQTGVDINLLFDTLVATLIKNKFRILIHPESIACLKNGYHNFQRYSRYFSEFSGSADYFITIGGDGTFLSGLSAINYNKIPLLGINTGRLGFLADVSPAEIESAVDYLVKGKFTIENRSLIEVDANPLFAENIPLALNEITVQKQDTSSMILIHTYIDDEFLASYMADGLIISTPTGSTAYSMSAGGPIISPDTEAFVITPIAPHNLTARPLVIPDDKKLSLKVETRDNNFRLAIDSNSFVLDQNTSISVCKSKTICPVIKLDKHNFYKTIRNKLMWGVDKRF